MNSLSLRVKLALEALIDDAANDDDNDTNDDDTIDNNNAFDNNEEVGGIVVVGIVIIVGVVIITGFIVIIGVIDIVGIIVNVICFVALVFICPTSRVVLVRLKANLENFCFIPLSKQVRTCSGLALVQTGSNLFELNMYIQVWHS